MKDIVLKDFMGIFPGAANEEYCEKVINRFEYIQETQLEWGEEGRGKIWNRQVDKAPTIEREDNTYFLGGGNSDQLPLKENDVILMQADLPLLGEFSKIIWDCYKIYAQKYGTVVNLGDHRISPVTRLQKTKPSQGYHVWHSDSDNMLSCRRVMVSSLFLNTIENGGETEFLYQSLRVPPVQGTLILFPAQWTHTHRGNPPLKENKYYMTTWLEFVK